MKKSKVHFWNSLGKAILFILKIIWFIIKIPYFIIKGILFVINFFKVSRNKRKIKKQKQAMVSVYEEFKVIKTEKGTFKEFENKIFNSDSKIGLIIGARGSGKTAFGIKFLENAYSRTKKKCFALGFKESEMPSWIKVVSDVKEISNDSIVLIDEGGILFDSRSSFSNANKLLSHLILIARHKNLTILFISQNSSNIEVNVLRQADFLILKTSSLLQKEFERKIVQKIYDKVNPSFQEYRDDKGITYIYSNDFLGFVSNPLPSFWKESISKSFK